MSDFVYLYGFVPAEATPPSNLAGVGGSTITFIDAQGVKAATSSVPAAEYNPAAIEQRLQDLGWVGEQGVAHERIVAWFADNCEILPAPLFTIFSTRAALQTIIEQRGAEIAAELKRLHNKREWDLKVSFDERAVEAHAGALSPRIAELEREAAQATPGKRYLIEKKRKDLLKAETRRAAHAIAQEVLDAARRTADDARTLPMPKTVDELPVIMHAALLVDRGSERALVEALERERARLTAVGMDLNFSGPWAPYRFTGDDERRADGGA